jgi:hypothetical protein
VGWLKGCKVLLNSFYSPLQPPPPKITDEKSAILGYSSLKRRRNFTTTKFGYTIGGERRG